MELTSSIIVGFIRLCLLLLFLYYLNRKFVSKSSANFLEFLVHHWFRYGSITGIVIFACVQMGIYDLLNVITIIVTIALIDFIGLRDIKNIRQYFGAVGRKNIQLFLKRTELKKPLLKWLDFKRKTGRQRNRYFIFGLITVIALVTFATRFYFFRFDQYSLTGMWLADLQKVIDFDSQIWFLNEVMVNGNLAFANFYSKIAAVSPEIALQSLGILECTLLSIVIFWVIRKITYSSVIASIVASLSFALALSLTPINIYFITQNKPIYLAMTFGFPTMVYLLRPGALKFKKHNYFFSILFSVICIGLINLFTLYILFPPFVLLAAIFTRKKSRPYYWLGLLAYLAGALAVFGIYGAICSYFETDLLIFLHSNLLSVSSYTYVPQLIIPFENLVAYYQIGTWVAMLVLLKFIFINKEKWGAAFAFLAYFNLLVLIGKMHSSWIDTDLLNQALSVFMPVMVGIGIAAVVRIIKPLAARFENLNIVAATAVASAVIFCAIYFQRPVVSALTETDTRPKQVLAAYDKITKAYFPYSYAVVNDNYTQVISTNKHFFMNYSDFLYDYPKQDSIYFRHIKNPKFFKKHPEHVIPKSVLLFVFTGKPRGNNTDDGDISSMLLDQVAMLQKRGRRVELFYDNKDLKVYEIINEPKQSRISDLIF